MVEMMADFSAEPKMPLKKFVSIYSLPQCAKVIEGYQDPENDDNEFSANDCIEVACVHVLITSLDILAVRIWWLVVFYRYFKYTKT